MRTFKIKVAVCGCLPKAKKIKNRLKVYEYELYDVHWHFDTFIVSEDDHDDQIRDRHAGLFIESGHRGAYIIEIWDINKMKPPFYLRRTFIYNYRLVEIESATRLIIEKIIYKNKFLAWHERVTNWNPNGPGFKKGYKPKYQKK